MILPGTINPLPALYDDRLIGFLKSGINTDVVFAAISSSPLLLAKAGVLKGKKFTAGFFMRMAVVCPFIEKENFIHKGIMCDGNVITGIGMFFREFAEAVLQRFGYDISYGPVNIFAQNVDTTQNSQSLYCFFAAWLYRYLQDGFLDLPFRLQSWTSRFIREVQPRHRSPYFFNRS